MSRSETEIEAKESEILQLGEFQLNIDSQLLQNVSGQRVALRSQSQRVLVELAKRKGEVVSKDDLAKSVWQDTFVTDDSLVQCIADIRRVLGDGDHAIIQTVPKEGYVLIASPATPAQNAEVANAISAKQPGQLGLRGVAGMVVLVAAVGLGGLAYWRTSSPPTAEQSVPLPTGPRIALIPFRNLGEDAEDSFFSEGLTRDINAQLARFSNLFVIASKAGEAYRDDPDCETIREELRADYILTGTVQRYDDRVRITTSFLDAETCLQLTPPGPFDRDLSLESVLDIQLEIASKVAAEVGSSDAPLFNVEIQREIRDKAPESLDAYECVLLGYWFYQTFAAPEFRRARECLERAVVEEPDYSLAWSRLAFIYMESKKRSIDTPPNWAQLADDAAEKALNADRDNPDAYYALAILSRIQGEDLDVYRKFAKRAIDLNPNDSWILADLGIFLAYAGEFEEGKDWITRARALNPRLHRGFDNAWHLHAFLKGDYEEARNVRLNMGPVRTYMGMASLAASYAMNDEQQEAEVLLARIREKFPDDLNDPRAPFRASGMPQELIEGLMEGLARAGLDVPPK